MCICCPLLPQEKVFTKEGKAKVKAEGGEIILQLFVLVHGKILNKNTDQPAVKREAEVEH